MSLALISAAHRASFLGFSCLHSIGATALGGRLIVWASSKMLLILDATQLDFAISLSWVLFFRDSSHATQCHYSTAIHDLFKTLKPLQPGWQCVRTLLISGWAWGTTLVTSRIQPLCADTKEILPRRLHISNASHNQSCFFSSGEQHPLHQQSKSFTLVALFILLLITADSLATAEKRTQNLYIQSLEEFLLFQKVHKPSPTFYCFQHSYFQNSYKKTQLTLKTQWLFKPKDQRSFHSPHPTMPVITVCR